MRTVLLVAAEPWELAGVPRRAGVRWVQVANGPGRRLVENALETIADRPDVVVSAGICGAVDPELRVGDVVVASRVNDLPVQAPRSARPFRAGPVVSTDHVAGTVEEKRALRSTGAIAVEMEAAAVAEWANRTGLPCYCIRAVSDEATEGFVLDLNAARDSEGRFSKPKILMQAARRPAAIVPELMRFRRNSRAAVKALGEFLGDCDF